MIVYGSMITKSSQLLGRGASIAFRRIPNKSSVNNSSCLYNNIHKVQSNIGISNFNKRLLSNETKETAKEATKATKKAAEETSKQTTSTTKEEGSSSLSAIWNNVEVWAKLGAIAGWGMSGAAIYDSSVSGPEAISLNMTGVLIVYSSLFTRWAYVVKPQNLFLAACHATNVLAQFNQLRRALQYKIDQGGKKKEEVEAYVMKAVAGLGGGVACVFGGPVLRSKLVDANLGVLSEFAAAPAGPFTVHFWAPMSKWLISGASFLDLHRPTDKISITQYSALTLTGLFFSRYSLLVNPINYSLCAVNIALFGSSAWHLGRKVNADYIEEKK